jgi:hypothetical protein
MNHFVRNSEILYAELPDLRAALAPHRPNANLEIISTPTGAPSALYEGISVHSRRDPEREARTLIEREVPATATVGVFYGFGLGYLVENFIRLFPELPCLVIEPDIGCFLKALEARDLSAVLSHPKTVFFLASEPTPVIRYLDTLELATVQIVKLRPLYEKDRAYYERTDELIRTFLRQRDVNKNTLARFGRLWVKNLVKNAPLLCRAPGINRAEGLFRGTPALVCAGGPSLDEVLPLLPRLRERMLIVAVDTTLAVLVAHGVDPDITVISDPQYWNTRHVDWVKRTGTMIVSESSTHPRIFRLLDDHVFFAGSVFPLGRFLESFTGPKGKLGAGGSVATTAWDCARYLGAAPVFMAGLDLGFPGLKTHFKGGYFEEAFFTVNNRLHPQEQRAYAYLREAAPFPVADNAGGLVLTDHRLAVFKFWFESQMQLHKDVRTFNLSRYGVKIDGMPGASAAETLALPTIRGLLEEKKKELREFLADTGNAAQTVGRLKTGITGLIRDLEMLTEAAADGVRAAREAMERAGRGDDHSAAVRRLSAVDQDLAGRTSREIAAFLVGPLIREINAAGDRDRDRARWLDYSLRLYTELELSGHFHIGLLKKGITLLT